MLFFPSPCGLRINVIYSGSISKLAAWIIYRRPERTLIRVSEYMHMPWTKEIGDQAESFKRQATILEPPLSLNCWAWWCSGWFSFHTSLVFQMVQFSFHASFGVPYGSVQFSCIFGVPGGSVQFLFIFGVPDGSESVQFFLPLVFQVVQFLFIFGVPDGSVQFLFIFGVLLEMVQFYWSSLFHMVQISFYSSLLLEMVQLNFDPSLVFQMVPFSFYLSLVFQIVHFSLYSSLVFQMVQFSSRWYGLHAQESPYNNVLHTKHLWMPKLPFGNKTLC